MVSINKTVEINVPTKILHLDLTLEASNQIMEAGMWLCSSSMAGPLQICCSVAGNKSSVKEKRQQSTFLHI